MTECDQVSDKTYVFMVKEYDKSINKLIWSAISQPSTNFHVFEVNVWVMYVSLYANKSQSHTDSTM